jgi:hypothetical protein
VPTAVKKGPGTDENVVNLDFTKLDPRGGGKAAQVPAGDYLLQLTAAKNVPINNQAGRRQIAAQLRIVGTPNFAAAKAGMGETVYQNLQIMPDSGGLWFTRNFVDDLTGKETTGKAFALRLDDKIGMLIGGTLADGKPYTDKNYEEQVRSEIKGTFPASRFIGYNPAEGGAAEDDSEEEEAPAPKAASNGRAAKKAVEAAAEEVASSDDEDEIEVEELENI